MTSTGEVRRTTSVSVMLREKRMPGRNEGCYVEKAL